MRHRIAILGLVALSVLFSLSPCGAKDLLVGRIYSVQGKVEVSRDDGKTWADAHPLQDLNQGDTIRTGRLSRVSVLMAAQTMVKIAAESQVKLLDVIPSPKISMGLVVQAALAKAKESLYRMVGGEAWFRSTSLFRVETPTATVGVRGTEFGLKVKPDGETVLSMLEGMAELVNDYGSIEVLAGEQGMARPGQPPVKRLLISPEDAVQWSLSYPAQVSFRDYFFVSPDAGRLNALLATVDEGLKSKGEDATALFQKGQILHDLGRWDEAQGAFERAGKVPSMRPKAAEGLGWVELQRGNLGAAQQHFKEVDPRTEMSVLGESLVLHRWGRGAEALALVENAMATLGRRPRLLVQSAFLRLLFGHAGEAMARLKEAASMEGGDMAYGLMSDTYLVFNQKDQALEAAREGVRLNPWSSTARVDLAWAMQAGFDLPGATEAARRACELDPNNVRAILAHGQLLFGSGHVEEAEEMVVRVLQINPREAMAHTLLGYLLLAKRRTDEAVDSFRKAIMLDSVQASPHLGLGIAFMRKVQVEEALQEILVATLLEPRESLNYTYLGKAFYQIKEFHLAERALDSAKALDPKDPSPYLYSGIMRTDLNQGAQAIRDLEKSVALNDNRAVYRSRFLLDEDRAVRNVNLARAYGRLGMEAMARNRAMLSLKDDPNNSAAHLYMAAVLVEEKDRTRASGSEILKGQLLEPPNQNSFNSFNQYTSVFESPSVGGSPETRFGNDGLQTYIADFWGSWEGLAFRELANYSATDGFKSNNFVRSWFNVFTAKYQLGLHNDLLVRYQHNDRKQGDLSQDLNAFAEADLDLVSRITVDQVTLGYHLRTSPASDILVALQDSHTRSIDTDRPLSERSFPFGFGWSYRQYLDRLNFQEDYKWAAATHIFRIGDHRVQYGLDTMRGRSKVDWVTFNRWSFLGVPMFVLQSPRVRNAIDPFYLAMFVQDTWLIVPGLSLEAGVFYERTTDGATVPVYSSREFSKDRFSPRVGLIYTPLKDHTFRVGYAEQLLSPFIAPEVLSPTDIAGFTLGHNARSSVLQKEGAIAWEAQWHPQVFMRVEAFERLWKEPVEGFDALGSSVGFVTKKRDFYGASLEWNIMFMEYFGFSPGYAFIRSKEREFDHRFWGNPDRWRDDHELHLGLHFWHPTGWRARFKASYVHQELHDFPQDDPSAFWFLEFFAQKELFDKRLVLGCQVRNLLDTRFNLISDVLDIEERYPAREFFLFARYNF